MGRTHKHSTAASAITHRHIHVPTHTHKKPRGYFVFLLSSLSLSTLTSLHPPFLIPSHPPVASSSHPGIRNEKQQNICRPDIMQLVHLGIALPPLHQRLHRHPTIFFQGTDGRRPLPRSDGQGLG